MCLLTLLFRMYTKQTPTANKYVYVHLYAHTNRQHMEPNTHSHVHTYICVQTYIHTLVDMYLSVAVRFQHKRIYWCRAAWASVIMIKKGVLGLRNLKAVPTFAWACLPYHSHSQRLQQTTVTTTSATANGSAHSIHKTRFQSNDVEKDDDD